MSTNTAIGQEGTDSATTPDERDHRALTQYLTVLDDVGDVRDADDLYLVVSQSGSEYTVDARDGVCTCPDYQYRDVQCKHLRRVAFATGERAIPADADHDPQLGEHVSGGPRYAAADGGVATIATEASLPGDNGGDEDSEECERLDADARDTLTTMVAQTTSTGDDLPPWNVYNATCKASLDTVERAITEEV